MGRIIYDCPQNHPQYGTVTTLAGTAGTYGSADGTGSAATFSQFLSGITTDGKALYVADGQSIRRVEISTGKVTTFVSLAFYSRSITSDGANLYFTDWDGIICKVAISTGVVTIIAGSSSVGSADGVATAASFSMPYGITTDGKSLFVADSGNGLIRRIQ